jgi:hypothetical protein
MGYDIPDKIRYTEKIVLNLDLKHLGYLVLFLIIAALTYHLPLPQEARIVLASIFVLIGICFAIFDLETKLLVQLGFRTDIRLGGYMDRKVKEFIEVKKIERNAMFLKNGELRAVILVKPVNFELMDESRQRSLILNYREFLNQLTFPIQIIVRTVNSVKPDYSARDERIKKSPRLTELYYEFLKYERDFIDSHAIKERIYYVVVPLENKRTLVNSKITEEDQVKELNLRAELIQERLGYCGLISIRLTNSLLTSLLMSYFEAYAEIGDDYPSRITVYNSFNSDKEVL